MQVHNIRKDKKNNEQIKMPKYVLEFWGQTSPGEGGEGVIEIPV